MKTIPQFTTHRYTLPSAHFVLDADCPHVIEVTEWLKIRFTCLADNLFVFVEDLPCGSDVQGHVGPSLEILCNMNYSTVRFADKQNKHVWDTVLLKDAIKIIRELSPTKSVWSTYSEKVCHVIEQTELVWNAPFNPGEFRFTPSRVEYFGAPLDIRVGQVHVRYVITDTDRRCFVAINDVIAYLAPEGRMAVIKYLMTKDLISAIFLTLPDGELTEMASLSDTIGAVLAAEDGKNAVLGLLMRVIDLSDFVREQHLMAGAMRQYLRLRTMINGAEFTDTVLGHETGFVVTGNYVVWCIKDVAQILRNNGVSECFIDIVLFDHADKGYILADTLVPRLHVLTTGNRALQPVLREFEARSQYGKAVTSLGPVYCEGTEISLPFGHHRVMAVVSGAGTIYWRTHDVMRVCSKHSTKSKFATESRRSTLNIGSSVFIGYRSTADVCGYLDQLGNRSTQHEGGVYVRQQVLGYDFAAKTLHKMFCTAEREPSRKRRRLSCPPPVRAESADEPPKKKQRCDAGHESVVAA